MSPIGHAFAFTFDLQMQESCQPLLSNHVSKVDHLTKNLIAKHINILFRKSFPTKNIFFNQNLKRGIYAIHVVGKYAMEINTT